MQTLAATQVPHSMRNTGSDNGAQAELDGPAGGGTTGGGTTGGGMTGVLDIPAR
jgi:hypothetical protein